MLLFAILVSPIVVQNIGLPARAASTHMSITNPVDGSNNFTYTTVNASMGMDIAINLTVQDVTDLRGWEARVNWDSTLLLFVSLTFPSDDVFFDKNPIRLPTDSSVPGTMLCGAATGPGAGTFSGTGSLAVLTLKIVQNPSLMFPVLTCQLQYTNIGSETLLVDSNSLPIPETPINGVYTYSLVQQVPDVAVTNVSSLKSVVGQGYIGNFTAVVENQGNSTENFNVTIYANGSTVGFLTFSLASGATEPRPFIWNTSGYVYGNYTMLLAADVIPGETDTADNNFTCPIPIHVGVPGDISGPTQGVYDGTVNMRDIQYMINHFNTFSTSPNWDPNADVNNDGTVNMRDITTAILNFNQHE